MATNSYDRLQDTTWGSAREWTPSHELPRRISERVLECHEEARDQKMYDSDAESAFERLALHAKPGSCGCSVVLEEGASDVPQRGKAMPFASGEASLPPAGTQPCDICLVSPKARYNFDDRVALPPSQIDKGDISSARAYTDASLRHNAARLKFAVRLWESGMLGSTHMRRAEVSVFSVMKTVSETDSFILRPACDMRQVTDGKPLQPLPDARACSELWPCMALGGQLLHGPMPPSFSEIAFLYWVFIDDSASTALQSAGGQGTTELVREAARSKLKEVGLGTHEDDSGGAMPLSLGVTITERPCRLMAAQEKIRSVFGATKALLDRGRATSTGLSRIIGSWVWFAMCCRAAFCLLDARYKFVTKCEGDDT
ncbi:unnamed protein product, partial [Prorocentrum cordatum]